MGRYLQDVDVILPVLGCDVLRPAAKTDAPVGEGRENEPASLTSSGSSPIFKLTGTTDISARAQEVDGEFILLAGSQLKETAAPSLPTGTVERRNQLINAETAIKNQGDEHYKLTQDIPCTSPSQAANIVNGYKVRSRDVWKTEDEDEMTYGDWRAKQFN